MTATRLLPVLGVLLILGCKPKPLSVPAASKTDSSESAVVFNATLAPAPMAGEIVIDTNCKLQWYDGKKWQTLPTKPPPNWTVGHWKEFVRDYEQAIRENAKTGVCP